MAASFDSILPVVTFLIGGARLCSGLYSFISPATTAKEHGIQLAATPNRLSKKSDSVHSAGTPGPTEEYKSVFYVQAIGNRIMVTGLTTLALTLNWQFGNGGGAAKHCVGIVMSAEAVTALVDAILVGRYTTTLQPSTDKALGKKGVKVHLTRTVVWLIPGILCLLG
ncbi:hypothetical protein NQ176_g1585 [Zarea fungicola]|uniref:Uncharacterized protein n=1 Tax=Zarea fungicola TaxID=93591 RepID=A0ACC1NSP6_9HYPO|nr:hypothetical protein NQ176_g1585 [Lecanicillium fungicola]